MKAPNPETFGEMETELLSTTANSIRVILRSKGGEFSFRGGKALEQAAMKWSYIVRNRRRWADVDELQLQQAERCKELMAQFGLNEKKLAEIVAGGTVEVSIPYVSDRVGWGARVFPWEYMLTAAARLVHSETPLVVRHLRRPREGPKLRSLRPYKLLLVESAPGKLRFLYTFDAERALVTASLGKTPADASFRLLPNPTREDLEKTVREFQPDIIHLMGFDTHQAAALGVSDPGAQVNADGMLLVRTDGEADQVSARELAQLLTAGEHKPALVSFNFWSSAARLGALVVAEGAGAAIGFQDEFEDSLAENLFTELYRDLDLGGKGILRAFQKSWDRLRDRSQRLQGSGAVLWSARSFVRSPGEVRLPAEPEAPLAPLRLSDCPDQDVGSLLKVEIEPLPRLNYCLLHNEGGLYRKFRLIKISPRPMNGVQVEVVLHAGSESFPCKITRNLTQPSTSMDGDIRIPLTSALGRGLRESIQTVLYSCVSWEGREVYRDTRRVALLSVDEWRDRRGKEPGEVDDQAWLPSFVLPRDPVVARVIEFAQRYLMVLLDDSRAGFDGYQSVDFASSADIAERAEAVDLQVQAVWSALLYDLPLSYVNPPPTYTESSQRLRTPSAVMSGKRGTCIDLMLLLAACLEYVDIYPVLFLLNDHAFPGYWRDLESHHNFERVFGAERATAPAAPISATSGGAEGQRRRWLMPRDCYTEILQFIHSGQLVPLETVLLTRRASFWEAMEEGVRNLRNKIEFEAMIDLTLARRAGVTPLPMLGENGI
jgi:hypothetical protein